MEWLLKIVEGPMKGAEIALPDGVSLTFGSGADCDVVVQDASVPEKACEFQVDDSGVKMKVGEEDPIDLKAYEMHAFGTTTIAIGPTEGAWEPLVRECAREKAEVEVEVERDEKVEVEGPGEGEAKAKGEGEGEDRGKVWRWAGWVAGGLLLVLIAAVFVWVRGCSPAGRSRAAETEITQRLSLQEIAAQHGLALSDEGGSVRVLRGNLARRTERLAIRALALAADPSVKFDLTDDETLLAASSELLFACSDGALKILSASNRVVSVGGFAPSDTALGNALRALNADVKGIERIDTSLVRVGGPAPAAVRETPFVREEPPGEQPVVAIPAHTPNLQGAKSVRDYPIAGILTVPYPCVVMRNGLRLVEGAQIGKAVLVKIEADKLTLQEGKQQIEWRP